VRPAVWAAAIEGIDLVSVDSARSVTTELRQVEEFIARKVDLIVMMSVDQKTSQTAAKLINKAGIPLVLLTTKFTDDFTSSGGKFVTYVDEVMSWKAPFRKEGFAANSFSRRCNWG
jgi:ABC-type sugar transport system substrate-binding protein